MRVAEVSRVTRAGVATTSEYKAVTDLNCMNRAHVQYEGRMRRLYWGCRYVSYFRIAGGHIHDNEAAYELLQQSTTKLIDVAPDDHNHVTGEAFLAIKTLLLPFVEVRDWLDEAEVQAESQQFHGTWCFKAAYPKAYILSDRLNDLIFARLRFA